MLRDINIIDIEASGLNFDSYPIEIAVLVNDKRESWLIKPQEEWHYWDDSAEAMHGISRELLQKEGINAATVVQELNKFLARSTEPLYSDAAYWDVDWIDTLYFSVNQKRNFYINSLLDLLDNQQQTRFKQKRKRLADSGRFQQHRAAQDVEMIREAFILAKA
ncbi:MAG: exonuclease domain-containing protein [Candidatus Thiodiazotropha sp.]|jgi:DNA polymerase III epsilon subunit-like protein